MIYVTSTYIITDVIPYINLETYLWPAGRRLVCFERMLLAIIYVCVMMPHRVMSVPTEIIYLYCDLSDSHWWKRLTHSGLDTIPAISQTTFSNALSWMKMYEFRLRFHWSLFPRIQLTILQHWFRWWPCADQATSHYLNQRWLEYTDAYMRHSASVSWDIETQTKWPPLGRRHFQINLKIVVFGFELTQICSYGSN